MTEQQIPKGYKLTEVGVIPDDWKLSKLNDICSYINDGTHHTPAYVQLGIPFYSVENVTNDDFNNIKYISEKEHQKLIKRCKPEKGDILLTRIGALGKTKLINWNINASIYVSLALLKLKELIDPKYVYAYSKSNQFYIDVIKRALVNATPQKINMSEIGSIPISHPNNKKEQTAIANALLDTDALINQLKKLITKKQAIKTATMQQLLTGKTRLPEFAYRADGSLKGAKASELGEIPEDWEVIELGLLVNYTNGAAHEGDAKDYGQYIIVNSKFISTEGQVRKYTDKGYCLAEENNILMVMSDVPNGRAIAKCFLVKEGNLYTVNQRICSLDCKTVNAIYLLYILNRNKYFLKFDDGAKQTNLRKQDVLNCPILVPLSQEQTAIATILSDMDQEITTLEQRLAKTEQIKQGMMQQLLTGKIRLI